MLVWNCMEKEIREKIIHTCSMMGIEFSFEFYFGKICV